MPASDPPSIDSRTAKALAACVGELLKRGNEVSVPGLGTFRITHHSSQVRQEEDDHFSVSPPREKITFEANA